MMYSYFRANKANTHKVADVIQFEAVDKVKAKGILDGLLKSVKFK